MSEITKSVLELLATIEQDIRLITTLKQHRDALLSACEAAEEWLPEDSDVREQVRKAIKEAGK